MICSVCSMFVHGHFCNFIISNGNHQNTQCAFSFMDPQRSIKFPRSVRVFGLCPKRNFYHFHFYKCQPNTQLFLKALFNSFYQTLSFSKMHFFIMYFLKTPLFHYALLQKAEPNSLRVMETKFNIQDVSKILSYKL